MEKQIVHILLVEDDVVDREAMKRVFEKLRISNPLHEAHNGLEALVFPRSEGGPAADRPFFIILDLNMPRMNGFEFLKELRADPDLRDTVVFVLTSSGKYEDVGEAWDYNVAGFLNKRDLEASFLQALNLLEQRWRFDRL